MHLLKTRNSYYIIQKPFRIIIYKFHEAGKRIYEIMRTIQCKFNLEFISFRHSIATKITCKLTD